MRLTVRFLLSLIVAGAMTLALVIMGFILDARIGSHLLSGKKIELTRVADDLARLAARDYDPDADRSRMDAWSKEMGELGNYRISLIDENGRLYGDSLVPGRELDGTDNHGGRPEVLDALETGRGQSLRYSSTLACDYLYSAARVEYPGHPRVLRVGTGLDGLNQIRYGFLRIYALVAGAGLALALTGVWLGGRKLAGSFQDIVAAVGAMADGRLDRRADGRAPAELGRVARAVNHLAAALSRQLTRTEKGLNQLVAVLEAMSDGLLVVDADGLILRANRRAEEMLGLKTGELRKVGELRYPELAVDFEQILTGESPPPRLLHYLGPPERFIEARLSPVGGRDGETVAVFHDLTERHRLYQMRRDFVANVSHELRTPLTAIMGVTENLREKAEQGIDRDEFVPFLNILERQTGRLHELARDVLELARLEKAATAIELKTVGVGDIFSEVLAVRLSGDEKDLKDRFILDLPVDMPPLTVNRPDLATAVGNLVDNALKYGDQKEKIVLTAGFNDDEVWIGVENSGLTIDPEDRSRIFERFYRGEKGRRHGPGGTGLGLAIVKHVAKNHGGSAEVGCPEEGRVVFTIRLPRRASGPV